MTERAFTTMVIRLAQLHRFKVAHFRPGMNRRGKWSTAVQADGAGWPDLVCVRTSPARIIVAELKVGRNTTTPEQDNWLMWFSLVGIEAFVWSPADMDEIMGVLST